MNRFNQERFLEYLVKKLNEDENDYAIIKKETRYNTTCNELAKQIFLLLDDYFVGSFSQIQPNKIHITFQNGERFNIVIQKE